MRKGQIKRRALLEEAERMFFTVGYDRTGIQDLVNAFHCTKGSFYHHFESKLQILSEVCALRSEKAFSAYKAHTYTRDTDRLNGLLYYALPFRSGEEEMLSLLLPLAGTTEGDVVLQAVLRAQREIFFPEAEEILFRLKEAELLYWTQPALPEMLWENYGALYTRLLRKAAAVVLSRGREGNIASELEASRFFWERLTDAPFGMMEIIRADEVISAMIKGAARAKEKGEAEIVKESRVEEEARKARGFAEKCADPLPEGEQLQLSLDGTVAEEGETV